MNVEYIADILGVDPKTLPEKVLSAPPKTDRLLGFNPLNDDEWDAVLAVSPKLPVPKPHAPWSDRIFVDAVLWWIAAKARGFSWHRLPPELGPQSSREHRHRRWCLLGYWSDIAEKLASDPRISADRLGAFQRIAEDAVNRKAMLLERRARLTDARTASPSPILPPKS